MSFKYHLVIIINYTFTVIIQNNQKKTQGITKRV